MLPNRYARSTRLAGLLSVALGLALLAVLPAQYDSLPVSLSLSTQAVVLYASTVAGPLLLAWGAFTFWDGTYRSLTTRRLLLALALSIGVLSIVRWRTWVLTGHLPDGFVTLPPQFIPSSTAYPAAHPVASPVEFAFLIWAPSGIGALGVCFAIVATALARNEGATALGLGVLSAFGLQQLGVGGLRGFDLQALGLLALVFGIVPFGFGYAFVRPLSAEQAAHHEPGRVDSRDGPGRSEADGSDPENAAQFAADGLDERARGATLAAVSVGTVLFGLYPANHFDVLWGYLDQLPAPLVVASAVVGAGLVIWAGATAWTGTLRWPAPASRRTGRSGE